jgi:predicted ATPase
VLEQRLTKVTIRNYRSLEDVTVDLDDLTILVGPNGSGKSNFLDALRFVSLALQQGLRSAIFHDRGSIWNLKREIRRENLPTLLPDLEIWLEFRLGIQDGFYGFILNTNNSGGYVVKSEKCYFGDSAIEINNGEVVRSTLKEFVSQGLVGQVENLTLPLIGNLPEIRSIYNFLSQVRVYSIIPEKLFPFYHARSDHPLDENGENLASMFRSGAPNDPWKLRVVEALSRIVPGISDQDSFGFMSGGGKLIFMIKHSDEKFYSLDIESDGTIRALALLTALYQTPALPLMAIEEPELMIHPGALAVLSDIILEASHRGQLILTTHSPDLISRFPADSLRIVERVEGMTKIDPIRDDQLSVINDKLFSGGDLLRIEGLQRRE